MMDQDIPCIIEFDTTLAQQGKAQLPAALMVELSQKHPGFYYGSPVELCTRDYRYFVRAFGAFSSNENFIKICDAPFRRHERRRVEIGKDMCRLGRILVNRPKSIKELYISAPVDGLLKMQMLGRILLDGCQVRLRDQTVTIRIDGEEQEGSLKVCDASTRLVEYVARHDVCKDPTSTLDEKAFFVLEDILTRATDNTIDDPCMRGILLCGPAGMGKRHLVRSVSCMRQTKCVSITHSNIKSDLVGGAEANLREKFALASKHYPSPVIILAPELEKLTPDIRESRDAGVLRFVRCFQSLLKVHWQTRGHNLIFIGTSCHPESIEPSILAMMHHQLDMEMPNEMRRKNIIRHMLGKSHIVPPALDVAAKKTHGYLPSDLKLLVAQALLFSAESSSSTGEPVDGETENTIHQDCKDDKELHFKVEHLDRALKSVPPSILREYRVRLQTDETWDDLGGMEEVKFAVQKAVEWPLKMRKEMTAMGLRPSRGVLLYGPPGCSKTTIARILAATNQFSFFTLDGAAVFSAYVGEAERLVRTVFANARRSAPALIFIDEIDALVGKRGSSSNDEVQERILATFLTEMDGVEPLEGVLVLGTTNRINSIDDALLRPGRFDHLIHVPLPDQAGRLSILKTLARHSPIDPSTDLERIAEMSENYSGAAMRQLVRDAAYIALHEGRNQLVQSDFDRILQK